MNGTVPGRGPTYRTSLRDIHPGTTQRERRLRENLASRAIKAKLVQKGKSHPSSANARQSIIASHKGQGWSPEIFQLLVGKVRYVAFMTIDRLILPYDTAFRKKIYQTIEDLHKDVDDWLKYYNNDRPHSGKCCYGKTPLETFKSSKHLSIEKNNEMLYNQEVSDSKEKSDEKLLNTILK